MSKGACFVEAFLLTSTAIITLLIIDKGPTLSNVC